MRVCRDRVEGVDDADPGIELETEVEVDDKSCSSVDGATTDSLDDSGRMGVVVEFVGFVGMGKGKGVVTAVALVDAGSTPKLVAGVATAAAVAAATGTIGAASASAGVGTAVALGDNTETGTDTGGTGVGLALADLASNISKSKSAA